MRKKKLLAQANKKYYNVCSKGKKVRETEERNFIKWLSISDRYTKMHLDRHLAPLRLNSSQYMYVIKICQHPGMTKDQFQACSYLNPSNITRSIATLEKEGFIIRKVSEQDKRTRHLYPTQKAKDACEKIFSIASEWEKKIFKDMTEEEKEGFLDQFLKISRNIVAELEKEEGSA